MSRHLIETDGAEIEFERIMQDLKHVASILDVRMVAFDKWQATKFRQDLQREGFGADKLIEVPMNVAAMSGPMKDLEAAVLAGRLTHDGNPAMAWMMSNVQAKADNKGNIYPVKNTSAAKIDGPVSLIMAYHCLPRIAASISVYESRGALLL
jgi:phage terminase large subunit-like protein